MSITGGPSKESEATYADLKRRWSRISHNQCTHVSKETRAKAAKDIAIFYASWSSFSLAWDNGQEDVTALSAQVSNLTMAERVLADYGIVCNDGAPTPAPDIEDASEGLKRAKEVEELAQDMGIPQNQLVPPWVLWAGGAAVGVYVLGKVVTLARLLKA